MGNLQTTEFSAVGLFSETELQETATRRDYVITRILYTRTMAPVSEEQRAKQRRYNAWQRDNLIWNLRRVGMTLDDVPWIRGKPGDDASKIPPTTFCIQP